MKPLLFLTATIMTINVSLAQTEMVEELTLSNGLTVWLSHDSSEPKVYGTVAVRAGAKHSPNTGIAHYFEHIMFKGTKRIGTVDYAKEQPILAEIANQYTLLKQANSAAERQEIQKKINQLNIEATQYAIPNEFNRLITKYGGTGLNAGTSYDYTVFFNTFSPEYLEHWCELNSERMVAPVFRLFQSELETVYEEKNMYSDNMGTQPMQEVMKRVCAPHPYQFPIIGSTEALKSPDLHAMKEFFHTYYRAGNMALILVGDFKREGLEELLERTFGKIAPGNAPKEEMPKPKPFKGHERLDVKLPIPFVSGAAYLWQTVPNTHPDQITLSLIQSLLSNEGKTGLLNKLTIEGDIMGASPIATALNDHGVFGFFAVPKLLHSRKKAVAMVMKEIDKIKRGDFTDKQLQEVKLIIEREYLQQIESIEKRSNLLRDLYAQGRTWDSFSQDLVRLRSLTKEEVMRVANLYLGSDFLEIRKKTGRYPKEHLNKPPYQPVVAPNQGAQSDFARHLDSLPISDIPIRALDFTRDIERRTLTGNGLVQLFKTTNKENDLFTLDLLYFQQATKHPRLEVLEYYLDLVGGGGWSNHEFNSELQALGASVTFESRDSFFVIKLTGFDHHFNESIALLSRFLFDVQAEKKAMKKLMESKSLSDRATKKDPTTLSKRLLELARYGEDAPYKISISKSELKKIKPADLIEELQQLLRSEVDIHYTGSLDIDTIAPQIVQALHANDITTKGEGYSHIPSIVQLQSRVLFAHEPSATQAIIKIYLPLGTLKKEQKAAIRLYNSYFGSGMSSLLFQEVREFRSLAYGVGGYADFAPATIANGKTDYVITLSTQADKVVQALKLVAELIERAPDDVNRYANARQGLLSMARTYYPTLRLRSRQIRSLERQGYSKDISLMIQEELQHLTQEQIISAHEQLVKGKPITITIVGNRKHIDLQALGKLYSIKEVKIAHLID